MLLNGEEEVGFSQPAKQVFIIKWDLFLIYVLNT